MSDDKRHVAFRAPSQLVDRADALAAVFGSERADVFVDALREYLRDVANDEELTQEIAGAYYEDEINFDQLASLVGTEDAAELRVSKQELNDDSTESLADVE